MGQVMLSGPDQDLSGLYGNFTAVVSLTSQSCYYLGGCGAMYEIFVESEDFRGKRQVHQHRLINQVRQPSDQGRVS